MSSTSRNQVVSYQVPAASESPPLQLVENQSAQSGACYTFYDRIEIGRYKGGPPSRAGILLINDPTVSSRHCIITQEADGRCYVRDSSRNGTRLDGRRLSPNLKTQIQTGQVLSVAEGLDFVIEGNQRTAAVLEQVEIDSTLAVSQTTLVTVVVGDIRAYTSLVQNTHSTYLQESVGLVFQRLEKEVVALGGTVKEYQGDALFAFWENTLVGNQAVGACSAALALDRLAKEISQDPLIWKIEDYPLQMDWALATGPVAISTHGSENALGLSMVGEPVVLAYRLEKFADDTTGSIVVCPFTQIMASKSFNFEDLGTREAKGFDDPQRLYSLLGKKEP